MLDQEVHLLRECLTVWSLLCAAIRNLLTRKILRNEDSILQRTIFQYVERCVFTLSRQGNVLKLYLCCTGDVFSVDKVDQAHRDWSSISSIQGDQYTGVVIALGINHC